MKQKSADEVFEEELLKASESTVRKKVPGQTPDIGIGAQAAMTRAVGDGAPPKDVTEIVQERTKSKMPKSTWVAPEKVASSVFTQKTTNPIGLANALLAKYGKTWIDWEPETLWATIEKDYGKEPGEESKNKIMAVRVLLSNDTFWAHWEVFEKICAALSGRIPRFDMVDDLSVGEISLGVAIASRIKKRDFDDEVKSYVAVECHQEGYVLAPELLSFAQSTLDSLVKGTAGEDVKKSLLESGADKVKVTDPEDPVHVQAGHLQAVKAFVSKHDDTEVKV